MSESKESSDHYTIIRQAIEQAADELEKPDLAALALTLYADSQNILERPSSPSDALRKLLSRKIEE